MIEVFKGVLLFIGAMVAIYAFIVFAFALTPQ